MILHLIAVSPIAPKISRNSSLTPRVFQLVGAIFFRSTKSSTMGCVNADVSPQIRTPALSRLADGLQSCNCFCWLTDGIPVSAGLPVDQGNLLNFFADRPIKGRRFGPA